MQLVAQIEILNAKLSMSAFGAMQTLGGAVSGGAAAAACAAPARWPPRKPEGILLLLSLIEGGDYPAVLECSCAHGIRNPLGLSFVFLLCSTVTRPSRRRTCRAWQRQWRRRCRWAWSKHWCRARRPQARGCPRTPAPLLTRC